MNEYVLCVIGTVLISAVLSALIPEGKTSAIIKGVARMACVLAIIAPIVRFFTSAWNGENFTQSIFAETVIEEDESFIQYCSEMRICNAERELEELLKEEFQVESSVTLEWEKVEETYAEIYHGEKIKITKIHVKNAGEQTGEVIKSMYDFLIKNYCSEVQIE